MPHDESQPVPTYHPDRPSTNTGLPDAGLPDTARPDDSQPAQQPLLRLDGRPALPGFELGGELGRGGMGVVYAARDVEVGREVAVKLLRPEYAGHESSVRRFVEEAQITGQLQHPGIPAVYRVGTQPDGRPFLAMKLVKGRTLADLLRDRDSPVADRGRFVAIFEGICQAVGYAHAHDVIHRDLKPQNVMVGAFGEVQVMDWGLAKVLASRERQRPEGYSPSSDTQSDTHIRASRGAADATTAGSILGTPAFMPPEQAIGAVDKIDARSDVFGLGGILCAILTGQPPYLGETAESTRQLAAQAKLADAFTRLDGSDADPDLVALCKQCLSGEKADRPADAGAVAAAVARLRAAADERARQAELREAEAGVRVGEGRKRQRVWYGLAAVFAVGATVATWQAVATNTARRDADAKRGEAETKEKEANAARRDEAKQRRAAEVKEAEATAVVQFFEDKVFAAGRPKGQDGGLGKGVSLQAAVVASLPALADGFRDQPLVEARLRFALSTTFFHMGDPARAAEQSDRARALFATHSGPDDPNTLTSTHTLTNCYAALGREADALRLREETLAARKRVLPPDHPDILRSMFNLSVSYDALGRHLDALKLNEETLAAAKRVLPPDHPENIQFMAGLAVSYNALGRHPEALRLREETLAAMKRVLPPDHPDILHGMSNLANTYAALGREADALRLREETLAAAKRVLPPDHPEILGNMNNLAIGYEVLGRNADALRLREETLAAAKRGHRADHPTILVSMHNLANSYAAVGRHPDALKLREETLAAMKRVFPANHPTILKGMNNLAESYAVLGRHPEALRLREETLAGRKQALPPGHPDILKSMNNLADSLVKLNRGAEAIPLIDEFVAKAAGRPIDPRLIPDIMDLRLRHFEKIADPAGCRTTAAMWEKLNRTDPGSLYDAACLRAVTARVYQLAGNGDDADAEAALAIRWLQAAVAAGYKNAKHMKEDDDLSALHRRADFWLLAAKLEGKSFEAAPPPRGK